MSYTNFGELEVNTNIPDEIISAYNKGFVLTRVKEGHMERVRSLRINLKKFTESSENRRILRKFSHSLEIKPIPYPDYSWEIHKLGKDFYEKKFGENIFTANKIKELFTTKNNFNSVLTFTNPDSNQIEGYCITFNSQISELTDSQIPKFPNSQILHYAYPFYNLDLINTSFGMYMMTKTISYAKEKSFDYVYLGSVHEKSSLYKLQFTGLEWWDEKESRWSDDMGELKGRV